MQIEVAHTESRAFVRVKIIEGNVSMNMGLLNEEERCELAKVILGAAEALLCGLDAATGGEGKQ